MKKLLSLFIILGLLTHAHASPPARTYTYTSGNTIQPNEVTTNEDNIFNYLTAGIDTYAANSITNAAISASAAIAYSKLNLASSILTGDIKDGEITSADISASAAIPYSKLLLTDKILTGDIVSGTLINTDIANNTILPEDINHIDANKIYALTALPATAGIIPTTNLGSGTGSSGNYLRGDGTWSTLSDSNLSNIIFSFALGGGSSSANGWGIILNDDITAAATEIMGGCWAVVGTTYKTVLTTKFKKISTISTITIWCSIWNDLGTVNAAVCKVDIGGQNGNVTGTAAQQTPEWKSFDIDISSLTNGTTYDVTIQLKHSAEATGLAYMDSIIGIAS